MSTGSCMPGRGREPVRPHLPRGCAHSMFTRRDWKTSRTQARDIMGCLKICPNMPKYMQISYLLRDLYGFVFAYDLQCYIWCKTILTTSYHCGVYLFIVNVLSFIQLSILFIDFFVWTTWMDGATQRLFGAAGTWMNATGYFECEPCPEGVYCPRYVTWTFGKDPRWALVQKSPC